MSYAEPAKEDFIRESTLRMFLGESWWRHGHRIQRCGSSTGHMLRDVAFCDGEEVAQLILRALETAKAPLTLAAQDLLKALRPFAAFDDTRIWLPTQCANQPGTSQVLFSSSTGKAVTLDDFKRAAEAVGKAVEEK